MRHGETRERTLQTAAELFHRQGYHGTGLNQVIAAGELPKGSLYFHFPGGKEQLAAEAMQRAGQEVDALLDGALTGAPHPAEALERVVEQLGATLEASGYRAGCPVATVALDAAADSELIRSTCAEAYRAWEETLTRHLDAAGVPDARNRALTMIATVEGALLLARTRRDVAPLRAVVETLRGLVRA